MPNSRLLKYVHPYDDTVFNVPQLEDLLLDLADWGLAAAQDEPGQRTLVDSIVLAVETAKQRKSYVIFCGA